MNLSQKAMFAVLMHVHSRKPASGRMPDAACGTQALPGEKFPLKSTGRERSPSVPVGGGRGHPNVIYLHPTLSFANKAGES
jgi:hypothetical protein